ncbi:MAG: response regulator transcription factor [Ornithinimicrobium sp.]
MARVLVVEDDSDISLVLTMLLQRHGHQVTCAPDGPTALRSAHAARPQIVVLDIGLPGMDGWAVLSRIRDVSDVPVLLLTAAGSGEDKVRGLRGGADDYLTKPFHNAELLARIDGLLRRGEGAEWEGSDLVHGSLTLSPTRGVVTVDGVDARVTPLEFRLLAVFLRHQGQVLTPTQLLSAAWGDDTGTGQERVKFAILRLRRKLGWEDTARSPLQAVRGIGYRLDADS